MRRPGGYASLVSPVTHTVDFDHMRRKEVRPGTFEADTFTCAHCNRVIHVEVKSQGDEYFCRNCMASICPNCADHPCTPFMKKIEQHEERLSRLRSYGIE